MVHVLYVYHNKKVAGCSSALNLQVQIAATACNFYMMSITPSHFKASQNNKTTKRCNNATKQIHATKRRNEKKQGNALYNAPTYIRKFKKTPNSAYQARQTNLACIFWLPPTTVHTCEFLSR